MFIVIQYLSILLVPLKSMEGKIVYPLSNEIKGVLLKSYLNIKFSFLNVPGLNKQCLTLTIVWESETPKYCVDFRNTRPGSPSDSLIFRARSEIVKHRFAFCPRV